MRLLITGGGTGGHVYPGLSVLEAFEPRPEFADIAAIEGGWLSDGQVPAADVARVWVSPDRARWAREEHTVAEELSDGAIVIEVPYGSPDWLLREMRGLIHEVAEGTVRASSIRCLPG